MDGVLAAGRELAGRLVAKHGADGGIVAVGALTVAPGRLELAVVTVGPEVAVPERVLRLGAAGGPDGLVVDVSVVAEGAWLAEAARIGPAWPLAAGQYLHTVALHDPDGFFAELRAAHETAVQSAAHGVFLAAAGEDLGRALAAAAAARAALAGGDQFGASWWVREAALYAALVVGLLGRTPYRDAPAALTAAAAARFPPGFGETLALALAPSSDADLAVAALGEALDALGELGRREGLPFEAADLDTFL